MSHSHHRFQRWRRVSPAPFFPLFFFSPAACYSIMKVRWWQRNAPHINLSAFSTMTAQFSVPPRTIRCRGVCTDADYASSSQIQFGCDVLGLSPSERKVVKERTCGSKTYFRKDWRFLGLSFKTLDSEIIISCNSGVLLHYRKLHWQARDALFNQSEAVLCVFVDLTANRSIMMVISSTQAATNAVVHWSKPTADLSLLTTLHYLWVYTGTYVYNDK